jgi:hypothetical protein
MRGLTVRNPWAWAIAAGFKPVDNRSLNTRYRGPLAIHAGQTGSARGAHDPRILDAARQLNEHAVDRRQLPLGAVVALAELIDCHPDQGCCRPWGESEYEEAGGRKRTAIYHLVLDDVRQLVEPVPCRGALGLWRPSAEVVDAIREQIEAADTASEVTG